MQKPPKGLKDSKIASPRKIHAEANEKLKSTKKVPNQELQTDVTPTTPIYLPLPE